ncbi:hypothetical protein ABZ934_01855 [Streptomyces sp. NPDC046557]|uniref:hypothetical protein n=1 Tax=Streptomyces sp. NPDC046557 TaxID=3155372 RepID=UPI0034004431
MFSSLSLALGVQTTGLLCGAIAFVSPLAAVLALRHPAKAAEPAPVRLPVPAAV